MNQTVHIRLSYILFWICTECGVTNYSCAGGMYVHVHTQSTAGIDSWSRMLYVCIHSIIRIFIFTYRHLVQIQAHHPHTYLPIGIQFVYQQGSGLCLGGKLCVQHAFPWLDTPKLGKPKMFPKSLGVPHQ